MLPCLFAPGQVICIVNAQEFEAVPPLHHQQQWKLAHGRLTSTFWSQWLVILLCWQWVRGCCYSTTQPGVVPLSNTTCVLVQQRCGRQIYRWHCRCALPHSRGCKERSAASKCTCVDGVCGGDVATDAQWLRFANKEVKDPVAKRGTEALILNLDDQFGGHDCVDYWMVVDEW